MCSARASPSPRAIRTIAPVALVGAAAAVAFLVGSTLYDVMSFPHAAYIFLYLAALVAVVVDAPSVELGASTTRRPRNAVRSRGPHGTRGTRRAPHRVR